MNRRRLAELEIARMAEERQRMLVAEAEAKQKKEDHERHTQEQQRRNHLDQQRREQEQQQQRREQEQLNALRQQEQEHLQRQRHEEELARLKQHQALLAAQQQSAMKSAAANAQFKGLHAAFLVYTKMLYCFQLHHGWQAANSISRTSCAKFKSKSDSNLCSKRNATRRYARSFYSSSKSWRRNGERLGHR